MKQKERGIIGKSMDFLSGGKHESDSDGDDATGRMNFKHTPINHRQNLEMINYLTSEHVKCLQQSKYIKFENDVQRILEHKERMRQAQENKENLGMVNDSKKSKMYLRYCKEDEVLNRNSFGSSRLRLIPLGTPDLGDFIPC